MGSKKNDSLLGIPRPVIMVPSSILLDGDRPTQTINNPNPSRGTRFKQPRN
jgi:hypothetical protein